MKQYARLNVVGARLLGPAPIHDVWFPLTQGVHALYGLNGAGKSRLLYGLADLLEGRPGPSYLVATPAIASAPVTLGFTFLNSSGSINDEADASYPWLDSARPPWHAGVGSALWTAIRPFLDEVAAKGLAVPQIEVTAATLIDEIVQQNLFALTAVEEGWLAAPAVQRDPLQPGLARALDRVVEVADELLVALESAGLTPEHLDDVDVLSRVAGGNDVNPLLWDPFVGLSGLFDALVDGMGGDFLELADLARTASVTPFRMGLGEFFGALPGLGRPPAGPAADLVRDDRLTIERLTKRIRARLWEAAHAEDGPGVLDERGLPSPPLLRTIDTLEDRAQHLYGEFLVNAPLLALLVEHPDEWFIKDPIRWTSFEQPELVEFPQLSQAQRRWALIAIALAAAGLPAPMIIRRGVPLRFPLPLAARRSFLLLDEPDAALHTTAQRHAVDGLVRWAASQSGTVIVATHSQEFLNHPGVAPLHVARDRDRRLTVRPVEAPQRERIDELGITPADVLLLYRAVLVVEGKHDQVVLDALIGMELDQLRVMVLPMRGGRLLATVVDSALLAHLSDVPVIAALDNLQAPKIQGFWEALVAHEDLGQASFDSIVKDHFSSRERDEEIFLIDYCRTAVELGQQARFRVFGFSKPDIPEYLPVAALVDGAPSWEALRSDFETQQKYRSFKPWLEATHGVTYTEELLRAAAADLDEVHPDFSMLLEVCRTAQQRGSEAESGPR